MDAFSKKNLKTSRGLNYTYYSFEGDKSLPTLLFQHGWPDHAMMWEGIAEPLRALGHPMVIPDMLGYDGTDKPTDPAAYRWDLMTQDLKELVDNEGGTSIISIGHDWGSGCATRVYHYHPDRVIGLVNLNVAYLPPTRKPFSLDAANQMTEQIFGYPTFSYWHLFTALDGSSLLKNNVERIFNIMHGEIEVTKQFWADWNAMREYLESGDTDIKLLPYAQDPQFKETFIERMKRDGFEAPQCWYKATVDNYQHQCDSKLPEHMDKADIPVLYIGAKNDPVCRPEVLYPSIEAGLLPKLEQGNMIDACHWVPYEKPQEIVSALQPWLQKHFGK